jgi:CRISPR-associated endonuclease/helicase Cas3
VVTSNRRPVQNSQEGAIDERVMTEGSRSAFTGIEVTLANHLQGVAALAAGFATRLGLPDQVCDDLRLAGRWHDAGKADTRFQCWLHGGSEFKAKLQTEPIAKSADRRSSRAAILAARERAGYPAGTRHEVMSTALMSSAADSAGGLAHDWPLVLHLVAAHHGHCRPFAPFTADPTPVEVRFVAGEVACSSSSAHGLERLDSGVAERFWLLVRKYGWWGLARLEMILRLADHRRSELEQIPQGGRGV